MKVGRDYSWWVSYSFEYEYLYFGEWIKYKDGDARRFNCRKRDIKKTVTEKVVEDIGDCEPYRNLKIKIEDAYMTTTEEI